MFTKRIIPCLDVNDGRVVKGVNFVNLQDAGDPVEIAKAYDKAGADEVIFLDITASSDQRGTVCLLYTSGKDIQIMGQCYASDLIPKEELKEVLELAEMGVETIRFSVAMNPVSYTHLDVYKRQDSHEAAAFCYFIGKFIL